MNYTTNTLEELIDLINQELTVGGSFTQLLPNSEIERIITTKALTWWYQNYYYAVQKAYYLLDKRLMYTEEFTKYKTIEMPPDIQSITWIFMVKNNSLISIGINIPNLSIGLGVSNQPYLASYISTIGDIGVYRVILDSFSDMLNQLSKSTVKFDYNQMSKKLNLLGSFDDNLVCECFVNVAQEFVFADAEFIEYATSLCMRQLGVLITRFGYTLQGGVTINGDALLTEGKEREEKVLERIKGMGNTSFFFGRKI